MLFNVDKCKCLHLEHTYPRANYNIGGVKIKNVKAEKDLGVTIGSTLDSSLQCAKVVSTANKVLSVTRRTYVYKNQSNVTYLYKSLARPHLKYCCLAWRPPLQKDIDNIDKIQRRAARMIPEISSLRYKVRQHKCGILSLETRRLRSDLILVFKIIKDSRNVHADNFFQFPKDLCTRSLNRPAG